VRNYSNLPSTLNLNPLYISGFSFIFFSFALNQATNSEQKKKKSAEGCLSVIVFKSLTSKSGEAIKLSFILTQSNRDKDLMNSLIEYLGCGNITSVIRGTIDFKVTKFSSIRDTIIPFFEKYPLQSSKNKNFLYFSEVVKLVDNKIHLTEQGLNRIRMIKINTD
jgi:hypothetical protein